jgi:hypothetical protein
MFIASQRGDSAQRPLLRPEAQTRRDSLFDETDNAL